MSLLGITFLTFLMQQPRATVEGVVIKMGSGEPIASAHVDLHPERGPEGREIRQYNATTGADGKFVINDVAPGVYRLTATRSGGYVPAEYGQRSPTGQGIPIELASGQKVTGVQLAMAPTGSITGRIYDSDGEPLGKAQVQALRTTYRDGRKMLSIVQVVETDDRGEYRLFWLAPGRYYVSARPDIQQLPADLRSPTGGTVSVVQISDPSRFGGSQQASHPVVRKRTLRTGEVVEETYRPVYYPGVVDSSGAAPIAVSPAAVIGGVDISVGPGLTRTRHIRGRVVPASRGTGLVQVMAIPRAVEPSVQVPIGQADANGLFDLAGATPGSYLVTATSDGGRGIVPVEVAGADVENVTIAPSGFSVSGRFIIDGPSAAEGSPRMADLRARLVREPDLLGILPSTGPVFFPLPQSDGSFTMEGVYSGDFRVPLMGVPPTAYVKSMRIGDTDVLESGLHLAGAPGSSLEIVIGVNAGQIDGSVVNARGEPLLNRTVVLVPDARRRHRADLYKNVVTDSSGGFRMQGITPGDYELFAWENIETGAWQDPDYLRAYEGKGKPIHINEGSRESVQLAVIP